MTTLPPPPPPKVPAETKSADIGVPYRRAYTGRRISKQDGKVYHVWCDVTGESTVADQASERWYESPPKKMGVGRGWIGEVYEFTPTADGSAYWTSGRHAPRYIGPAKGADGVDVRVEWSAADKGAETAIDREKRREDAKAEIALRALLTPVREAYNKTNGRGKRAILAAVMEAITGGGGL